MTDTRAVVAHNVVAMRAEPDGRAEQVSQALFGETVKVLRDQDEFAEIETPDGYGGWSLARHLVILESDERYPNPAHAALVAPLFLPVHRARDIHSERITLLTLGTAVEVGEGDVCADLVAVRLPRGRTGYVEGGALLVPQYPSLETLGPNLIVVARALIGVPYLWGGRTPFGIDCSGFVQRVYWLCGHTIPRDAYLQAQSDLFEPVERDALKPGDLVFFAGDRDPRKRVITHVGMAMGDCRFIHASGQLGVAVTPLDEPPYDRQFWGARRVRSGVGE